MNKDYHTQPAWTIRGHGTRLGLTPQQSPCIDLEMSFCLRKPQAFFLFKSGLPSTPSSATIVLVDKTVSWNILVPE